MQRITVIRITAKAIRAVANITVLRKIIIMVAIASAIVTVIKTVRRRSFASGTNLIKIRSLLKRIRKPTKWILTKQAMLHRRKLFFLITKTTRCITCWSLIGRKSKAVYAESAKCFLNFAPPFLNT